MNFVTLPSEDIFKEQARRIIFEFFNIVFSEKKEFVKILNKLGYRNAFYKTLTLGTCTIYCAEK